jgi:carbonic anhydrase
MKKTILLTLLIVPVFLISKVEHMKITPEEALERLVAGNKRYVSDKLEHPNRTSERREAVVYKQNPFATIVGCSDSRVSPEILFDQGVGDLFVVRIAGNVVGILGLDSIDFSALYLGCSLILVLGHENCGAVKAVVEKQASSIEAIATLIEPAVILAEQQNGGDLLTKAIKANVRLVVGQLRRTPILASLIEQKKIMIVGGYYNLQTGAVELLD